MATLEAGTTLSGPLTSTVTLKNSVEIFTRKNTYLKNTSEATGHPAGREECESAIIRKKAQLTHYDQQGKQQSTKTLATKPQQGPANPEKAACMSRTAIGDDH